MAANLQILPKNNLLHKKNFQNFYIFPTKGLVDEAKAKVRKAVSKSLSLKFATELLHYNPDSPIAKSYKRTFYCSNTLIQSGKKLYSEYCKNRWCVTCNRIRMAKLIDGYHPELVKFKDPQFVTLTKKTVFAHELRNSMALMDKTWSQILKSYRNVKFLKMKGIKNKELKPALDQVKYHYHFHLIVDGKEAADFITSEWVRRMKGQANERSQKTIPVTKTRGALKELFKYVNKLGFTDSKKKGEELDIPNYYRQMDVIFRELRNRRCVQPFGDVKMCSEEMDDLEMQSLESLDEKTHRWVWVKDAFDWVNEDGECFSGHKPSKRFIKIAAVRDG